MIRYAIDNKSNFTLKPHNKYLSVIVEKPFQEAGIINKTGIYLWVDDGTILLAQMIYGSHEIEILSDKAELVINTSKWTQTFLRPGSEVAKVIPLASAYYGSLEMEEIRIEWFNSLLTE